MSASSDHFAATLRRFRCGRSQATFARLLGIKHQQTYQAYEAGRIPSGETCLQIADYLGITVDELLRPPVRKS